MNTHFARAAHRITIAAATVVVLSLTAVTSGAVPAAAEPDTPITPAPVEPPAQDLPGAPAPVVSVLPAPSAPSAPGAPGAPVVSVIPVPSAPSAPEPAPSAAKPASSAPSAPEPAPSAPSSPDVVSSPIAEAAVTPAGSTPVVPPIAVGSDESAAPATPTVGTETVAAPDTAADTAAAPSAVAGVVATSTAAVSGGVAVLPEADTVQPSVMTGPPESATAPGGAAQQAQVLTAPAADVRQARIAQPVEVKVEPAAVHDVVRLASILERDSDGPQVVPARGTSWDHTVRQWNSEWVHYDEYHRPVITNPYRDSVRIAYVYEDTPRIAVIPPLASIVLEAARLLVYSFTAVVVNALNTVVNVAVGSFLGGGFVPAAGLPVPVAVPLARYDNVPVQVRYSDARYQPFVVRQVVDTGDDPQYGERRVLLDGATPVWGQWTQTASGQRQFEVHRTQQYPGLDAPREAPLPGDYRLRLAADNVATGSSMTYRYLAIIAAASAALSLALVGLSVYLGRRRPAH